MTEAIREAIGESELSFKALERETGVLRQSLMKFAAGEQTLRLDAADKLADYFGIKITKHQNWWVFYSDHRDWELGPEREQGWWVANEGVKNGDLALIYVKRPLSSLVGIVEVVGNAYPKKHRYSKHHYACDFKLACTFRRPLSLADMRKMADINEWSLVRRDFRSQGGRPPMVDEHILQTLRDRLPELRDFL